MQTSTPSPTVIETAPQPRVFFGWYLVAACVAINCYLSMAFFQGFQVFFLPIVNEFGWGRTLTSGAFALRQLETGVLAPVLGFMVDRMGPRWIIIGGILVGGLGMVYLSTITEVWQFYLAFVIISFGMSGASHGISWPSLLVNWFRRQRGRALGLAVMGPVVGAPFIPLVQILEEALGWRMSIFLLGVGIWVICIPLALIARERPEEYGLLPDGDPATPVVPVATLATADAAGKPAPRHIDSSINPTGFTVREAARSRAFWMLVAVYAIQSLGVSGVMVHQIPMFQSFGFTAFEASLALALVFGLSGVGRFAAGALMDYFDRRLVLAAAMLMQAISFVMLTALEHHWLVYPFAFMFGAAFGSTIPARPLMLGYLFGQRAFGALQGLVQGAAIGAGMLGPLMMGASFDFLGGYIPATLFFAVITFVSMPLVLFINRPADPAVATA